MSSEIRALREFSNDPYGKFLSGLAKKFSEFVTKDQAEAVENPEDIYSDGQDFDSVLKYHNFVMAKKFNLTTQYYSSADPDYDKLRLWILGRSLGNTLKDYSGYDRIITLSGDPVLVDGTPLDWGISSSNAKSVAIRFNRPASPLVNREYLTVTHDTLIRASEGLSSGISFFIRFRVFDLAFQGGTERTLFEKTDNNPLTDGIRAVLTSTGRIRLTFKNSNVTYATMTATGTIATNTVYDVWITYTKSGNVFHIYVNNVDKTLSADTALAWHSDLTSKDYSIFAAGQGTLIGLVYGDLYDFRVYREKIISSTQVGYLYTNKWTIANIPFGQVAISNYGATVV